MANPKYIKIPEPEDPKEKVVYSFRIERQKLDKLRRGAENENKSTAELLNKLIDDLTDDKILTNDYLKDHPQNAYFRMPTSQVLKEDMTTSPENIKPLYDLITHTPELYSEPETEIYKILYPPNNCDVWQPENFSFSSLEDPRRHHGIELLVIPNVISMDLRDALYFIYSVYDTETRELELYILNQVDALNFINRSLNRTLIGQVNNLLYDLERVETLEDLQALADEYNTGNIIKAGYEETEPAEDVETLSPDLTKEADPEDLGSLLNDALRENERLIRLVERQDEQIGRLANELEHKEKELSDRVREIENAIEKIRS